MNTDQDVTEDIIPETKETNKLTDYIVAKKFIQLKQSADSRNIEFDLKFSTVKKLLNAKRCFYTNLPFTDKGTSARSIDRVDASIGYVENNVVPCTIRINQLKSNFTTIEIFAMADKIKVHNQRQFKKDFAAITKE